VHPTPVAPSSRRAPDRTRSVIAAIVALVGLVWIGQGVGAIGGSFMSGDAFWAVVGLALVAAAIAYAAWPRLRRR
jgi:hypothetical protein